MTWYVTCGARLVTWLSLAGLLAAESSTTQEPPATRSACTGAFQVIGGRCIFVEPLITGTWSHVREVCHDLGGDLVGFQDANFLSDVFQHLVATDQAGLSYWVGANDLAAEGRWVWADDLTGVHMGTPLWGDLSYPKGALQPTGGLEENCAVIRHDDAFYMHDVSCGDDHALMCEQSVGKAVRVNEDKRGRRNGSSDSAECPPPYMALAGRCLVVDAVGSGSWSDRRDLCRELDGEMIKVDDANLLGSIYDYFVQEGIYDTAFWVGSFDEGEEGEWLWLDGSAVRSGTPFWGNFGLGAQEPGGGTAQNCAALNAQEHFLMHDYDCFGEGSARFGVICER